MGGGNMEEVTCAVIGGVAYNQLSTPDFKVQAAPEEESLTGSEHFQPTQMDIILGNLPTLIYFEVM